MKVFRVIVERDGPVTKSPGVTSVEVRREEHRFAAETIQQVWVAIDYLHNDPEALLIAIVEDHPAITVFGVAPRVRRRKP